MIHYVNEVISCVSVVATDVFVIGRSWTYWLIPLIVFGLFIMAQLLSKYMTI